MPFLTLNKDPVSQGKYLTIHAKTWVAAGPTKKSNFHFFGHIKSTLIRTLAKKVSPFRSVNTVSGFYTNEITMFYSVCYLILSDPVRVASFIGGSAEGARDAHTKRAFNSNGTFASVNFNSPRPPPPPPPPNRRKKFNLNCEWSIVMQTTHATYASS